jgi:hypothetical protein
VPGPCCPTTPWGVLLGGDNHPFRTSGRIELVPLQSTEPALKLGPRSKRRLAAPIFNRILASDS